MIIARSQVLIKSAFSARFKNCCCALTWTLEQNTHDCGSMQRRFTTHCLTRRVALRLKNLWTSSRYFSEWKDLSLFGRVSRMPEEKLPKQALLAKANGRRPFGRSPKQNDGCNGRPWSVAAKSWAAALATPTEKWTMRKKNKKKEYFSVSSPFIQVPFSGIPH